MDCRNLIAVHSSALCIAIHLLLQMSDLSLVTRDVVISSNIIFWPHFIAFFRAAMVTLNRYIRVSPTNPATGIVPASS